MNVDRCVGFCAIALALLLAPPAAAADGFSASDFAGELAGNLSQKDAMSFMAHFDRSMPEYDRLRRYISALTNQEVACSIDIFKDEGDAQKRTLALDWTLQLASGRRSATVRLTVELRKRRWKITGLAPVEFFAPPPL